MVKTPSRRQMINTISLLQERINTLTGEVHSLRTALSQREAQLRTRLDQSMLKERIALSNSLGQMIEATSKAIMFVVGKEQM